MSQDLINEEEVDDFRPLTPEQANAWRRKFPQENVWHVLKIQCCVGGFVALLAFFVQEALRVAGLGLSALYGVSTVIIPAAICARGLGSRFGGGGVAASVAKFFVWEFAKVALSASMLMLAPKILSEDLSWPALMAGLVFTFKGFWAFVVWRQFVPAKSV